MQISVLCWKRKVSTKIYCNLTLVNTTNKPLWSSIKFSSILLWISNWSFFAEYLVTAQRLSDGGQPEQTKNCTHIIFAFLHILFICITFNLCVHTPVHFDNNSTKTVGGVTTHGPTFSPVDYYALDTFVKIAMLNWPEFLLTFLPFTFFW